MADRSFYELEGTPEARTVIIDGYVQIAAGGAVVSDTIKHASVAKTATGTYTITLEDAYPGLLHAGFTPWLLVANKDVTVQVGAVDVTVAKTIVFRTMTGANATDTDTGLGLSVFLVLKNSTV